MQVYRICSERVILYVFKAVYDVDNSCQHDYFLHRSPLQEPISKGCKFPFIKPTFYFCFIGYNVADGFYSVILFSECSRRPTCHHWDWQLRRAGSCEHSSAWGSRPSQFTCSHMTRPDARSRQSSPRVQVNKDRKLECSHKLIPQAELLQALTDAATSVIQEKAIFHCHYFL